MGNTTSNTNNNNTEMEIPKDINLEDKLDFIATHYIFTMDYQSLRKLYGKDYCEKLVILTSDIINAKFNHLEIDKIAKRIEGGENQNSSNEDINSSSPIIENENEEITYFRKDDIDRLNIPPGEKRIMICNEIAKFYIKIAHIFSAIVTTINPEYVYTDFWGNTVKRTFAQKNTIPKGVKIEVNKMNLCGERIDALKGNNNEDILQENINLDTKIKVQPNICEINLKKDANTLEEQPGIPELIDLYYDDNYNFKTGNFEGMSEENKSQYLFDLKRFYSEFTGNTEMPSEIKKFSDIQMKDYNKSKICANLKDDEELSEYNGTYKDFLFSQYANNLRQMVNSVNEKQQKLLSIIDRMFVNMIDPISNKKFIRINPELTDKSLHSVIYETRNLIVDLYLKCEMDFTTGVKLYEAIVESTIEKTLNKQIINLEKVKEELSTSFTSNN